MRFINRPMRDRQSGMVAESIIKTKRADLHVKEQSTKDLSLSVTLTIGAKLRAGENQSPPHAREAGAKKIINKLTLLKESK